MSLDLYDNGILAKFENWTSNTSLHVYGPNDTRSLIELTMDEKNDKPIQLPILSISRSGGYQILNANKKVMTYDGLMTESNVDKSVSLNAIPIHITYQIDVWCRYMKEADAYMRDVVFNIINHPTIKIMLPYNNIRIEHNSTMRIVTDVLDNSELNRLSIGQYTRLSIGVGIDDAYIWDTRIRDNISVIDISAEA